MNKCNVFIESRGHKAALLSFTSAMSCWSFSIPAGETCPFKVDSSPENICHGCYAQLNRYNMPNVLNAQWVRYMWLKDNIKTNFDYLVTTMTMAIKKYTDNGYFRVHDSGDFFHPRYIDLWYEVCQSLPKIKFWFPTRTWDHKGQLSLVWKNAITRLAALPNVTIRPSAINFNDPSPKVEYLSAGSTVVSDDRSYGRKHLFIDGQYTTICPKSKFGGDCEGNSCRSCWDSDKSVAYIVHGSLGRKVAQSVMSPKIRSLRGTFREKFTQLTIESKK